MYSDVINDPARQRIDRHDNRNRTLKKYSDR
jgi:hypothetical protein